VRCERERAGQRGGHLLQLDALLVLLLQLLAQRRGLAEDGDLQRVALRPLLSHLVQLGGDNSSLGIELLLADALKELRPLSSGIALLLRAAARHACWAPTGEATWANWARQALPNKGHRR